MRSLGYALLFGGVVCSGGVFSAASCSAPEAFFQGDCEADALFPTPECLDAGTDADASSDDGGGGSSARNACPGRCVRKASSNSAGTFSKDIVSLWVGPADTLPDCPANVPVELFRRFNNLVAPPAECDACECGASEGACTLLPETIEIRAASLCDPNAPSLPFDGPAGWNGSCSNEGALPAGQLCNGVPCAQSVWSPLLPGPTTESCAPKSVVPAAKIEKPTWELGAVACFGNVDDAACNDPGKACVNDPGLPWLQCVYYDGRYKADEPAPPCPDNFNDARYTLYLEKPIDDRGCEPCSCGDPVGSGCYGSVSLYSDGACSSFVTNLLVSTNVEGCQNVAPPGIALGSKKVNPLGYMPGSCAASGGTPTGSAKVDDEAPTTFCCTSFWDIK